MEGYILQTATKESGRFEHATARHQLTLTFCLGMWIGRRLRATVDRRESQSGIRFMEPCYLLERCATVGDEGASN